MIRKLLPLCALLCTTFSMSASAGHESSLTETAERAFEPMAALPLEDCETWIGYVDITSGAVHSWGTRNAPSHYDAAICTPADSSLVAGKTIRGIRFSTETNNLANVKVWIATPLDGVPGERIYEQDITDLSDNGDPIKPYHEIRFDTPFSASSDQDYFFGYSFDINEIVVDDDKCPLVSYWNHYKATNATWTQTINNQNVVTEWYDKSPKDGFALALQLLVYDPATGITEVIGDIPAAEEARFTIDGRRISQPVPGINVVRYTDGNVRKVIVR